MGDIGPANIECPGNAVGQGEHDGRLSRLRQRGAQVIELGGARPAGEFKRVRPNRRAGRFRPVGPYLVERVGADRDQPRIGAPGGPGQYGNLVEGVQPGVVSQLPGRAEVGGDPFGRCRLG